MIDSLYLILIIVGGSILCIVLSCVWIFKVFLVNRRKTIRITVPVTYLPRIVVKKEVIVDYVRPPSKRELRKKRIQEIRAIVETPVSELEKRKEIAEDDTKEETPPATSHSIRSSFISRASFMTSAKMLTDVRSKFL